MKMTETERVMRCQPEDKLLFANRLFFQVRGRVTKAAYNKALSRLVDSGVLRRFGKGIYYRPKQTRFGMLPIKEAEVEQVYAADNRGLVVGYKMYNRKGLTTQISKQTVILSTVLDCECRSFANGFRIVRLRLKLTPEVKRSIEVMEILQNARQIENLDMVRLREYIKEYALVYNNDAMEQVLLDRRYQKSTIASMVSMLDYWGVSHTLGRHISVKSRYKSMMAGELYESARSSGAI